MSKLMDNPNVSMIETFYILDLDRCLVNTNKLHNLLEIIVERETPISSKELKDALDRAEHSGITFDTARYVHQALGALHTDISWVDLLQIFIKEARAQDMFEPYARELLAILREKQLSHGILTYGIESWQLAKIEACDLAGVPHEVTSIKEKGELFKGWKRNDGYFIIPPALCSGRGALISRSLTFLDDKAVSFKNIPEGVRGIRVRPMNEQLLVAQQGPLPDSVIEVEGFLEAIKILFEDEHRRIIDKT
jgi:hypothetical protein